MNDTNAQDDTHKDEFERKEDMFHPDQVPRLSEDGARPAAPADDVPGRDIASDDPLTDDDIDQDELYQEGIGQASGATSQEIDSDSVERVDDENLEANGRAR